ncbi:hypothetical protein [Nocardioides insulae]|nr:hypothetical protein [Nocardioides insulae]
MSTGTTDQTPQPGEQPHGPEGISPFVTVSTEDSAFGVCTADGVCS